MAYRNFENREKIYCSRIVLILDASGSMSSQKSDIIGGINEMIKQQRQTQPHLNNRVQFNIVKFNDIVEHPTDNTLANVSFLTSNDYIPSGTTALYDAMGLTMKRYMNEKNVICLVATDGQENSSEYFKHKHIINMVKYSREMLDWNFIYLSEDIDTFKQGSDIGIDHSLSKCSNINVGKNKLGSALQNESMQYCIAEMRKGNDMKISSKWF